MPKSPKTKFTSKTAALTHLRTVLPTYAPGATGSKSRRFLKADWVQIEEALIELGGLIESSESGGKSSDEASTSKTKAADASLGGGTAGVSQHCVRCHRDFDGPDDARAGTRCQIPHLFDDESSVVIDYPGPGYSKTYRYDSTCCGKKVRMTEEGSGNNDYKLKGQALKPCVALKHTANPADVQYNESNVIECVMDAEGKCDLEPLDQGELTRPYGPMPHFSCNGYDTYSAKKERDAEYKARLAAHRAGQAV